jgi:hypothetical protein
MRSVFLATTVIMLCGAAYNCVVSRKAAEVRVVTAPR